MLSERRWRRYLSSLPRALTPLEVLERAALDGDPAAIRAWFDLND